MHYVFGICVCKQKWWYTGEVATCPPCGTCGRKHTSDDLWRAREAQKKMDAVDRAGSAVSRRAAARA